ncbi:MAG: phospholipase D-like domain-containing protein [Solirubrobacteraceae bacterium]
MPRINAIEQIDRAIGDAVEHAACAHHERRMSRLDQRGALEPQGGGLWCAGEPPPRAGNSIEFEVDGASALPRIARELEGATEQVHIAGWHVQHDFELERGAAAQPLKTILAGLAERIPVRVLAWAGAPAPIFKPTRRQVREGRKQLCAGTQIRCVLDSHERPMHCHHEKLVVIDDRVAFVGGIDLTALAGDRYDSCEHPERAGIGWHDGLAVIRGPAVTDVAEHFRSRWQEVAGESLPAPRPCAAAGDTELQIVRTLPERTYRFAPRGDFRIMEAYVRALSAAQQFIYLENQFLWSPELVRVLADKLRSPPSPNFRLLLVLPAKANNGADDTRGQLGVLLEADGGAGRMLACTLYSPGPRQQPVYVHAKIAIVDDRWLTIGSANLNSHSLFNDGEVNVVCQDPALARALRERLWSEHLERTAVSGEPVELIDRDFKPRAAAGRARLSSGRPLEHRLVELPGVSKRSKRLLGPLQGLLVDG